MALQYVENGISHIVDYYKWTESLADKRVADWPLMSSPLPTMGLVFVYLVIVKVGPIVMENRKPFKMREALIFYNLGALVLNLYIGVQIASALWFYFISKLFEFCDTFFFILRKKNSQLTFLHIYHHSTMFFLWWIGIKYVAGGSSFLAAMVNSFIHVIMYAYYGLAAFGPHMQKYLRWKKYLTCVQMIQFSGAGVLGLRALVVGCDFPLWMQYALVVYMLTFIFLFSQFYSKAYKRREHHVNGMTNGTANGVKPKSN